MLKNKKPATVATVAAIAAGLLVAFSGQASASAFDSGIPAGWAGTGGFGALGANGVVTTSAEGGNYGWVSTNGGVGNVGLGIGSQERLGSRLRSGVFSASAGDSLNFYFNYVTSDGKGFADYAWARLLDASLSQIAVLFTARTTPSGDSVPGFGMPPIQADTTPDVVTITAGAPDWSPLGGSSNTCYGEGCGFTGWVKSLYTIATAGNYMLEFGVVNWSDNAYQSGLAFDGITVGGKPIEDSDPIPEPGTLALLGVGLAGLCARRRRHNG